MIWLILIGIIIIIFFTWRLFKIPKINCMSMITGGVKTGKSMLALWIAIRKFKSQRRKYYLKCLICKIFRKPLPEKPLLYSNVELAGVEYVLITKELLQRIKRFRYGSVIYIQEASLVADSQSWKEDIVNESLLLFNKLIGHETRGGYLIYDTQSIQDTHYNIKRCTNTYLWIHHNIKIPFFCILRVREMIYSEETGTMNMFAEDVEDNLKIIIIPKKVWKIYDAYCYSILTDNLPIEETTKFNKIPRMPFKRANLKTKHIVSFKKFKTIKEQENNE